MTSISEYSRSMSTLVLVTGLVIQLWWIISHPNHPGSGWYAITFCVLGFALILPFAFTRIVHVVATIALALVFILSVADRLGFLGDPGAAGVSWGAWDPYVDYTHSLTAVFPIWTASLFAMFATFAEIAIATMLLIPRFSRFAALTSSLLVLIFGVSMSISLGASSPNEYAVWPIMGIGLALAVRDQSRHSRADEEVSASFSARNAIS